VDYNGTVCNGYIDYKVWLPDGATIDLVEAGLIQQGIQQVGGLVEPCKSTFMSYTCSVAYPRPVITGQTNSYNVLFACQSTCQAVQQTCKADLTFLNMTQILPDCKTAIPGTE
ncbi:hypothetical protein BGZ54_005007, partial [Gamsiella multidivaricata]